LKSFLVKSKIGSGNVNEFDRQQGGVRLGLAGLLDGILRFGEAPTLRMTVA
jgi:hypothetical protein